MTFWSSFKAFAEDVPPVTEKLVEPIFAHGGALGVVHGPRGTGKTQIMLSLALAVEQGKPWLGVYKTRASKTAFIQLDMPRGTMWERAASLNGQLSSAGVPIVLWDRTFDIVSGTNTGVLAGLQDAAPELVLIESLRKCHHLDENDSNTPVRVYKAWQERFPDASLLFAHHDRKLSPDGSGPQRYRDESFRGSSAWLDDADLGIHVIPEKPAQELAELQVRLEFSKVRSGPLQPPMSIRFNEKTLLPYVVDPSPETSLKARLLVEKLSKHQAVDFLKSKGISQSSAYRLVERIKAEFRVEEE